MKHVSSSQEALVLSFYARGQRRIVKELDSLECLLQNLQYEGKVSWGKNKEALARIFHFFNQFLITHLELQEFVIYPYFKKHVPKYEPVMEMLLTEHHEVRTKLRSLEYLFKRAIKDPPCEEFQKWINEIEERSLYFVHLLRHHLRAESNSVYKIIADHLTDQETNELSAKLNEQLSSTHKGELDLES